jgi:hypothetical protein
MRELEFLPAWYPLLRRKRQRLMFQLWLTGAIIAGLTLWIVLSERNVRAAEYSMHTLEGQLNQADDQLHKLGELESYELQLSKQAEIRNRLGPHVSTSRIINVLDESMPPGMAMLDLYVDTETQEQTSGALSAAAGKTPVMSRRLQVRVHGVTPNDADLGDFVVKLADIPYISEAAPTYSKDRVESGRLMREFEVRFVINLSEPRKF